MISIIDLKDNYIYKSFVFLAFTIFTVVCKFDYDLIGTSLVASFYYFKDDAFK